MSRIHPTALVDAGARIADDVAIGAYTIVGPHVAIGQGTEIGPHAVITGHTVLGARNRIFQFASVGEIPQDRKYGGEATRTEIGDDNVIREFVTIHAGTAQDRGATTIGHGNWFLAYTHVAHDCVVGDFTTFSNNAQIAGHVTIGDWAVLGAYAGVHQFCRIGAHAMIAAGTIVLQDVPPFVTAAGYPAKPAGTNNEGLRRRGFSTTDIAAVRRAYKTLYRAGHSLEQAREEIVRASADAPLLGALATFLETSGRGIVR
ncbi:MAG TPA: acyl-ACP--UDP-N-acetylglucosamine O-acyltransferase [Casimicrobiaceae bacterium]|nr:acyl-ACP--UDP-N-acetylglucosamine O-acyltransferase [Casimicrobiaceae bacterium]